LATVEHGKGTKSSEALHQNRIGIDLADTKKDNSRRLSALALTNKASKVSESIPNPLSTEETCTVA
jgi:hypothetical protein